jgi:hypothetical protein
MSTRKRRDGHSAGLGGIDQRRRAFIRKLAAGTAFAVPMVASFSTDGLTFNKAQAGFSSNMTNQGGFLSNAIRFFLSFFKGGKPM